MRPSRQKAIGQIGRSQVPRSEGPTQASQTEQNLARPSPAPSGERKGARAERNFAPSDRVHGDRAQGDRAYGDRPQRGAQAGLSAAMRGRRALRQALEKPTLAAAEPPKDVVATPLPIKVQTVTVTADENGMRVDRFLEARFPGLSFSHIQRIVRKGELRVNGKRADSKDRIEEGQSIRIPPLKLDTPKVAGHLSEGRGQDAARR